MTDTTQTDTVKIDGVTKTESSSDFDGPRRQTDTNDVIQRVMKSTSDKAEARLWAKRQARAEARERGSTECIFRMRFLILIEICV
jgi:hypothetical protein